MDNAGSVRQVPQTPSKSPRIRDRNVASAIPSLTRTSAAQGTSSLEDYLHYGASTISATLKLHEADMVKNFVNGLTEKAHRASIWDRMEIAGWTWVQAEELIGNMIANGKQRLRGGKVRRTN